MKILIISDTHGYLGNLGKVLQAVGHIDHLIHCGDVEEQMEEIERMAGCPCTFVQGNNDFYGDLPKEAILRFGKYRIFVTHGHRLGIYWGTQELVKTARSKRCNLALYGHTHIPVLEVTPSGLTILNPGSLTYPRHNRRQPTFATMEIDSQGRALFTICYVKPNGSIGVLF